MTTEFQNDSHDKAHHHIEANAMRQRELLKIPETSGISVSAFYWPADHITGDGFGIIADKGYKFYTFDVTGHGPVTTLDWGLAFTTINIFARMGLSPMEVMYHTEYHLAEITGLKNVPITAIYGEVDLTKNIVRYVHGGHVEPFIFRPGVGLIDVSSEHPTYGKHGKTLNSGMSEAPHDGVPEDLNYFHHVEKVESGDLFILYTDGVTDSRNRKGESLGKKGFYELLKRVLLQNPNADTENTCNAIELALMSYFGSPIIEDDLSVMIVGID